MGSMSVMVSDHATREPAPEPRPGPTGMLLDFAYLIKSATIRKYPENPMVLMMDNSYSKRSM